MSWCKLPETKTRSTDDNEFTEEKKIRHQVQEKILVTSLAPQPSSRPASIQEDQKWYI